MTERHDRPGAGLALGALGTLLAGLSIVAFVLSPTAADGQGVDLVGARTDRSTPRIGPPPLWADGMPAVPTRYLGPQGRTGQFVATCGYSHSGAVDPIVFPGVVGRSHRHDFYGATATDQNSTPATLRDGATTCDKPGDTAAYWQPTLYDDGVAVEPTEVQAYYRAAPGVDRREVVPFPQGLALIAGDPLATGAPVGEAAGWTCGSRTALTASPTNCSSTAPVHLVLTFPDCWDGLNLDSPDHRSHATYSRDGECPTGSPVHIPQLTMSVAFPVSGPGHDLRLASGSVYSAHGDFLNGWDPVALRREVEVCIRRGAVCDLASNREEDGPFFTE